MEHLSALPVVVPFLAGPLLVAVGALAPRWFNDSVGALAAIGVTALCVLLAVHAIQHPYAYWMGGWRPAHEVAVGISLSIDGVGAGMAAFSALLVVAALIYSLRYFDAVEGLYHGLIMLFMAGMVGFSLTGDLFNLIVFFEVMSAAAFALTAYKIEERGPIQGALNFAITNSIAGFVLFIGAGLLYARTGALNMTQIGLALSGHRSDPLVIVAMVLLFGGFLTKAAVVPMHFWTADAEAVAPIPVCALFSGVMVALGIYAVARLYWVIFAGPMAAHEAAVRAIFVGFGVLTALVGAVMCVMQRHLKRLLAFSTISHVGIFLCGVALLSAKGLAGTAVYIIGHGLTKAALFMCVGVLSHRYATIDEYELHGRARHLPIVGVLMVVGAMLLGAIPPFTTFQGKSLLEDAAIEQPGYAWLVAVFIIASALTGGAVLRICGRVFLGWGAEHGPHPELAEAAKESIDEEREPRDHTPPIMVIVPGVLLAGALAAGLIPDAVHDVSRIATQFVTHANYTAWVLHGQHLALPAVPHSSPSASDYLFGALSALGALLTAALGLWGYRLTALRASWPARSIGSGFELLRNLHSGHIGDYVAWWSLGVTVIGGVCLVSLR